MTRGKHELSTMARGAPAYCQRCGRECEDGSRLRLPVPAAETIMGWIDWTCYLCPECERVCRRQVDEAEAGDGR